MKVLALIPARGGSKGLLKKNIIPLAGRPLICHTIQTALDAGVFDRIIVTTDDDEIARVAAGSGAEVPFMRPAELAKDEIKDFPVFAHALRWLNDRQGYFPEIVVALRPTCPLRTVEDIRRTLKKIQSCACDSVRTACPTEYHPYRMVRLEEDMAQPLMPKEASIIPYRRQELPPVYRWNGLAEAIWSRTILERHMMFGEAVRAVITPRERSIDIDDEFDLYLAECVLKWKSNP